MNLHLEAAAIARIAEQIAPMCDGDEQLLADMMEGETDLNRIVARMHEQIARDEEMLAGIKDRSASLKERKDRIEARRDTFKAGVGKLLRAAQLTKLELPEVTYSVRDGKPTLQVVDPAAVPPEYQRLKPEPDKARINGEFAEEATLPNWLVREPARDVVTARTK